jgi:hypothetical protein
MARTSAMQSANDFIDTIDRYNHLGFPLESISFSEKSLTGGMNWAFSKTK